MLWITCKTRRFAESAVATLPSSPGFTALGGSQTDSQPRPGSAPADMRLLEVERTKSAGLEARLTDMDRVIDERRRFDAEAEERRRLTAVLADLRAPQPSRRWWRWL